VDSDFAAGYRRLQERHWWFSCRSRVLRTLLGRLPWPAGATVLEVGPGPGHDLGAIYPRGVVLTGLEADPALAEQAKASGVHEVHCGSLERMPAALLGRSFDVVAMFDVLEHIEDDRGALRRCTELLNPGGLVLVTVPAYDWMWGRQDEVNRHFRRYTRGRLLRLLAEVGLAPVRASYFNTILLPPIALFRVVAALSRRLGLRSRAPAAGRSDFDVSLGPLDGVLAWLFGLEAILLRRASFPCGVSVFAAARRAD
jgi:SAM-dependent methyltransferase